MAQPRHKRDSAARALARTLRADKFTTDKHLARKVAAPIAAIATTAVIGVAVLVDGPDPAPAAAKPPAAADSFDPTTIGKRDGIVSRSAPRDAVQIRRIVEREARQQERAEEAAATRRAVAKADTRLWATSNLNIWPDPSAEGENLGLIDAGDKVLVTGRKAAGRVEVVLDGKPRWVTAGYLSDEKPVGAATPGTGGTCTNGTSVASGVSGNIVNVHRTVCARFPEISVYGTLRGGGGDHPLGRAVDIMVSGSRGWQVAEYVRANAGALGVTYVIYSQQIWSVERSGEGWRAMSDRGSSTANHYDHVHVSTY